MFFQSALVASALMALANGQTVETFSASSVAATATQAQTMPPQATAGFNIGNVTDTQKLDWCRSQLIQCPQICGGSASANSCDNASLQYSCICANGTVPDSTAYILTVPYYMCQQTFIQCNNNNPDNLPGQQACAANEQCGTRNATAEALALQGGSSSSSSSSSSASSTGSAASSAAGSGSAASSAASATASAAQAPVSTYATGAFAAALMAAFKLML